MPRVAVDAVRDPPQPTQGRRQTRTSRSSDPPPPARRPLSPAQGQRTRARRGAAPGLGMSGRARGVATMAPTPPMGNSAGPTPAPVWFSPPGTEDRIRRNVACINCRNSKVRASGRLFGSGPVLVSPAALPVCPPSRALSLAGNVLLGSLQSQPRARPAVPAVRQAANLVRRGQVPQESDEAKACLYWRSPLKPPPSPLVPSQHEEDERGVSD